ncbi:MAG: Uncharacterised protein [Synechococcus sp. CC9902]|nr:MAG: Uncharacterised protein [Synechococcus sp. CC9902]
MHKIFKRKKLLIIAGPTACGKSTFRKSVESSQQPELTKIILKRAFQGDCSNIKTLPMKGLRRRHAERKNFQKFTRDYFNFTYELDTTCPATIKNLMLLPVLLKEFDKVLVVHVFVPFDIWIQRIRERRFDGFKTSRYVNLVFKPHQVAPEKQSKAQKHYHGFYSNFEYYFNGLGVKEQMCINTMESIVFNAPYPFL